MFRKFEMFMLYTDSGQKILDLLNHLFPGLIRQPQRVRVPVRNVNERRQERKVC